MGFQKDRRLAERLARKGLIPLLTGDPDEFVKGDGWCEPSAPGAATWGALTGQLSDQADLQAALDSKSTFNGTYAALTGKPTLGSAASTDATAYATAAQGAKADSAIQVVGYATGGAAVTQLTNKATGVTINARCGRITMHGAALAAAAEVSFVVTNNQVAATDCVIVNVQSVGTPGAYLVNVASVDAGSFRIAVGNCSTGSLSQAIVLNFAVIKSVAA